MTKTTADYPARWYASKDTPCRFYDTLGMSNLASVPDASDMLALTQTMWEAKGGDTKSSPMIVQGTELVAYTGTATATATSTSTATGT